MADALGIKTDQLVRDSQILLRVNGYWSDQTCEESDNTIGGANTAASDLHTMESSAFDLNPTNSACAGKSPPALTVRPLEQVLDQWKELIGASGKGTLFHTPAWAHVLRRTYGFRPFTITLESGGKFLSGCLLSRTRNP